MENGKHLVSTDGDGNWHRQACKFLKLKHHHTSIHHTMRKVLLKEQSNFLKIELKVLMIISIVEIKEDVN